MVDIGNFKMLIRPAGSYLPLDEAMLRVVEISNYDELMVYLKQYYWEEFKESDITWKFHGYDKRIDWDTYLLCIKGQAVLFTKGYLEDSRIIIKKKKDVG